MYPREHGITSAGAAALYAGVAGFSPSTIALWAVVGAISGIFIDTDHLVLAAVVGGKQREAMYWVRHPLRALLAPRELVDDIHYDDAIYLHRIATHLIAIGVLALLIPFHRLFLPASIGLGVHIVADVIWDLYHGAYSGRPGAGSQRGESRGPG